MLGTADDQLRALPWRDVRDPWAVLVSELMLQQTQVARVLKSYGAFMERFPTPVACAAASAGDVVRAWGGLGYNRRAVHLHAAARRVVDHYGGKVPEALDELLTLPGVGPYTARAVLAFAFEQPVAVVDVNVVRVLSRAVTGTALSAGTAQQLADRLVPGYRSSSWSWNQAMVELGATICTARAPRCESCRLSDLCAWRQRGRPAPDPAFARRRQSRFEGSTRQGRGRLLGALRRGPVPRAQLAEACGWPGQAARAEQAADGLVADGLARRGPSGRLELP